MEDHGEDGDDEAGDGRADSDAEAIEEGVDAFNRAVDVVEGVEHADHSAEKPEHRGDDHDVCRGFKPNCRSRYPACTGLSEAEHPGDVLH